MTNRLNKFFFGSIAKELFWVIVVCLVFSYIFFSILWFLGGSSLSIKDLMYNSNEIFVELDANLGNFDEGKAYVDQLAKLYKMNIAVTNNDGGIVLKDSSTIVDYIDLNYIQKVLLGEYKGGEFYQLYNLEIGDRSYKLVVWRSISKSFIEKYNLTEEYFILTVVCTILAFAALLYFLINRKIKYISHITDTITSISYGNLNEIVDIKGYDELSAMAGKINEMTYRLKNTIEQERAAENFKRELITNVSHDLRTPLTSIIGYLELLKNKELRKDKKENYIDILNTRANRLKYLIDDLFEFSKIVSGGEKLNSSSINIVELLEQCIGEYTAQAVKRGISFRKNIDISEYFLYADAVKMARVFENIISNAIKYSKNGSIVYVNAYGEACEIIISIKNSSSVALDTELNNIFERFYRMDKSRNSRIDGSGLGLAISKSIIELHKGEIGVETKNNEFEVFIKLRRELPISEVN